MPVYMAGGRVAYRARSGIVHGASTAPAWFVNLAERTWTDIAGGTSYSGAAWQKGARLTDVAPSPLPSGGSGHDGIIKAYNGAQVFQARREYVKAAEGGHGDYTGNEIYALALGDEVPAWKRIWGPTPSGSRTGGDVPSYNAPKIVYADGAPTTAHGYNWRECTEGATRADDRIWLLGTNQGGLWTSDVWSIARASLDVGVTDASLWMYHGRAWTNITSPTSGGTLTQSFSREQGGQSAWDPVGKRMWLCPQYCETDALRSFDTDTAVAAGNQASSGPQVPGSDTYAAGFGTYPGANAWSVIVHDNTPRVWVIGCPNVGNELLIVNLSTGATRTQVPNSGTIVGTSYGGAAYHQPSRKAVIGGPEIGATLKTLAIPADAWNATTGWTVGTITNAGGSVSSITGYAGTFSQFRMVNDMGNGQACLVFNSRGVDQPTYVYKLPTTF